MGKPRPDNAARNRDRVWTPEMREKVGAAFRGRKQSPEHVAKAARARTGRRKLEAGYDAVHKRARAVLPSVCQNCGSADQLEVCLREDAPPDTIRISNRGHRYSIALDPLAAYRRLCRSCHRRQDRESYSGANHWRHRQG